MQFANYVFLVAASLLSAPSIRALDAWADRTLPVSDSLELWFDVSRENAARSNDMPQLSEGGAIDFLHDASGHGRHLAQPVPGARPHFFRTAEGPVARFDGAGDFLFGSGINRSFTNATIFIRGIPRSNKGGFGALLSFNRTSANDYSSGFNFDLGFESTKRIDFLNVEGCGFTGIKNLLNHSFPFGGGHLFTVISSPGENGVRLWVDGAAQQSCRRDCPTLACEQFTLGARFFSNAAEPPHVQGFFDGDISEVLIYSRALNDDERWKVEQYLLAKHRVAPENGRRFVPLMVSNPPPVQMFVPGFTVRELPVKLNNINDVKYRDDGKLVALGYDGNIWLLSDSDGDGLEDKANAFWTNATLRAPIGLALTPPNYARGRGVFVPSKSKVSLIVDTNADDVVDEEIIVAQGWKELPHGVDALGAAVDKDGNLFFGLGTTDFTSAYLIDKTSGKARYDLKGEHGTILKVSPDFTRREIVCTGIRFPVALAFNATGDLFCTDQEGATWLPNGNPLDELLHIQSGRHYGFPPRHPKHLPNVIDEPSVFDYAPQHQSTCGLNFNEPVNGEKVFGPSWWRGDALVTGYSRGKLWRTKLVKTSNGYVAQSQLIACLNMLAADACVSPQGDLVVAAHTGQPDWGSGPNGAGKLYKISYSNNTAPQPVLSWAASRTETVIEFDRALDPLQLQQITRKLKMMQGCYVSAGDEFETLRPGYQAVRNQLAEPRYELDIYSVQLDADGRTLLVRSVPRAQAVSYAVTLPWKSEAATVTNQLSQHSRIDLAYDLTGIEASWTNANRSTNWSGWLPHLDLNVARAFTAQSAAHSSLWSAATQPGELTLRAQLDLWQMLRAATQPGSKLDFEYPPESVTVVFNANVPLKLISPATKVERNNAHESRFTVSPQPDNWTAVEISLETQNGVEPALDAAWFTAEDARLRPLPLRRLLLPWALPEEAISTNDQERVIPEIAGGNWLRGKRLFFSEQVACSKCHQFCGEGGKVGPDLSNLIHRDYASVMKDIAQPSASINPDHVAYNIELKNGEALTGVPVGGGETEVLLADASGRATLLPKNRITSMKPSNISLMPEGLLQGLSAQQIKDLLTFLLMPPPLSPAKIEISGEPPPRKRAEVEAVLKGETRLPQDKVKRLKIVLCAGPKDHGPGEHDYPLWQQRWTNLLGLADGVTVEGASRWPTAQQLSAADVIIFYSNNPEWSAAKAPELDSYLKRGGGLVFIHFAVDGHNHCDELAQRIGLAWRGGASKFRHGPVDLKFEPHEITKGFGQTHFVDETYWNLVGSATNVNLLASAGEEGAPRPLIWTREQNGGRVFVSILGHYSWTFDDPLFRLLLLRGIAWSAHEPIDRFSELATVGARIAGFP